MEGTEIAQVLIVEDDEQVAGFVSAALKEAGFVAEVARDGVEGLKLAEGRSYDVMVIDLILPGMAGLELIRHLRSKEINTPIIVLSGKSSVRDRVAGLQTGADDYLVKPFAFDELLARIQSLIRRDRGAGQPVRLKVADVTLDLLTRRAYREEDEIDLQPREFVLLEYLMRNRGRVVTRSEILHQVWGYDFNPATNLVDVHICRIREKIERPGKPRLLRTVRGIGYVLGEGE
jgi:DNA-binding response OmpR family regulator